MFGNGQMVHLGSFQNGQQESLMMTMVFRTTLTCLGEEVVYGMIDKKMINWLLSVKDVNLVGNISYRIRNATNTFQQKFTLLKQKISANP